jgi:pimeloyl-ACP methyl ester carboxylesterase
MECTFPAVFLGRGRLAPLFLASASAFHIGNARIMGLGRFVWSFMSMHPAILYATGPGEWTGRRGRVVDSRDDTLPKVCAGLTAAAVGAILQGQARRRFGVLRGRGDEQTLTTRAGNRLAFRRTGPDGGPVVVLEAGLLSTAEHWEWITQELAERLPVVTYHRAGYGPSRYRGAGGYRLDAAVDDLVELVEHVADGRQVLIVGHSLGGYLALKAAERAPRRVAGVGLLDSSHPAELQRSSRQAQGQEVFTTGLTMMPISLSLGLGALLKRPDWVDALPEPVQGLALAQYRDPRLWAAGRREWDAVVEEFGRFDGRLPDIKVPLLVLTAGFTAANDAVQKELHDELADAAPRAESHVLEEADHDSLLTDANAARRVAGLIREFAGGLRPVEEVERDVEHARQDATA